MTRTPNPTAAPARPGVVSPAYRVEWPVAEEPRSIRELPALLAPRVAAERRRQPA